ncbi:uncharacterized protein BDV17DRAFT_291889 [Aspergillus undulatus]|uniref:uncharacterized protein n=1 Tax=Aspergillus undulatus TaxID=1810928 RepID=UPI003CCD4F5D
MTSIFLSVSHKDGSASSIRSSSSAFFSKFKKHFANFKAEWGPCMAAKTAWDDEYNFPAGRWAGQGLDPTWWHAVA